MAARVDILEYRTPLAKPFAGSLLLHVAVFGGLALFGLMANRGREQWGDPTGVGGGSVGITPVKTVPLPARSGIVNPVANDTESRAPAPPQKTRETQRVKPPDPDAIALKGRRNQRTQSDVAASRQRYRAQDPNRPNQLYSSSGQATVSPMFGSTSSSGTVGYGQGSPFGNRFGYYEQLLRDQVSRHWNTSAVDPTVRTAPPVIVAFEIMRNGQVRGLKLLQRSGNYELDMSAQRAISAAAPFPPLPQGYERDSAVIEFWFILKR